MALNSMRTFTSGDTGLTLVELMVVISIISILLAASAFAFHDWIIKSKVEAQVREMAADISQLRIRALTMKQRHSFILNPGSYSLKSYSSEGESIDNGTYITGGTHTVSYNLKKNSSTTYSGEVYEINSRGMIEIDSILYPDNVIPVFLEYNGNASFDCVNLYEVRVNTGKANTSGDKCDDR